MLQYLQTQLLKLQTKVRDFNLWVAALWPGAKTKAINALTAVAGLGLVITQMFDVIDLRQYIETKTAGYILLGVALLNYWLKVVTDKAKEVATNVA